MEPISLPSPIPLQSPTHSYSPIPPSPYSSVSPSLGHSSSSTLSCEELEQLRRKLGPTSSVLCAGVVKLYLCNQAEGESSFRWSGLWGALSLTVDRTPPASKHLQLHDLHGAGELLFSVQLYEAMAYLAPQPSFHCFEVEGGHVGLSFASAQEAHIFERKVAAHVPPAASQTAIAAKPHTPKTGFFQRLFHSSSGKEISAPSGVVKQALPEEWQTLLHNAAINNQRTRQMSGQSDMGASYPSPSP